MPQNYLDVERDTDTATGLSSQGPGTLVQQISFSSVDYTIDDHDAVDPDMNFQNATEEPVLETQINGNLSDDSIMRY